MKQSEKIIDYQVFTRLFGDEEACNAHTGSSLQGKTDVVRWAGLQTRL